MKAKKLGSIHTSCGWRVDCIVNTVNVNFLIESSTLQLQSNCDVNEFSL